MKKWFYLFLIIFFVPNLLYAARVGGDTIIMTENGKRDFVNRFIVEKNLCEDPNLIACNVFYSSYFDLCLNGLCFSSHNIKIKIYKMSHAPKSIDIWVPESRSKQKEPYPAGNVHDEYSKYLKNFVEDNQIMWQTEISLPPFDMKVYGVEPGQSGGTQKSRIFELDVTSGKLHLIEEYIWESKTTIQ